MAEFGWSYISCGDVLTGSGGPEGAVQFKTPGGIDGSPAFIYDTGSNRVAIGLDWPNLDGKTQPDAALHVVGDVSVTGTIFATEYQILNVTRIEEEGSTKFGTNADDDHEFTGSLKINGTLTTNGTVTLGDASDDVITSTGKLTASAGILIPDAENATDPTNTTVGLHIGTGADLNIYHNGTDSHIANSTGDLKIQSSVNSAECILIRANGGTSETIKIYSDQGTAGNSITLASDAGGILFNLDATSGKKIHADVESTDADSIHLDSEGGIKLESDAHPVNITGDLTVSGSSLFGTANTDVMTLVNRVTASGGILISDASDQAHTLQIGTGGDLYLAHDGSDSIITNGTGKFKIQSTVNASEAIRIRANGGTDETIFIRADQGTSVMTNGNSDASVQLKSDAGGVGIRTTSNLAGAIQIEADGGTSETIIIKADQGTAENSIQITSDAGGVDINAGAAKDVTIDGGQLLLTSAHDTANSIYLRANAGTSETIKIHADQGTSAASINIASDVGGISLSAGTVLTGSAVGINLTSTQNDVDCIHIRANAGTSEVLKIHSDQGTSATEGAASVQITSDVGGINLLSGLNGDGSIRLTADGGTNETIVIHSDQGTGVATADYANTVNASIALTSDAGGIGLGSAFNGDNAIRLEADGGANETIVIHSNQGTGADSIHLVSDVGGITLQVGSGDSVTVNGGHLIPSADDTIDLGGASNRWRNIYTGDLHLKNDRGDWTIVEESDYLSLRNNNTGKLYKFVMEEVLEE